MHNTKCYWSQAQNFKLVGFNPRKKHTCATCTEKEATTTKVSLILIKNIIIASQTGSLDSQDHTGLPGSYGCWTGTRLWSGVCQLRRERQFLDGSQTTQAIEDGLLASSEYQLHAWCLVAAMQAKSEHSLLFLCMTCMRVVNGLMTPDLMMPVGRDSFTFSFGPSTDPFNTLMVLSKIAILSFQKLTAL